MIPRCEVCGYPKNALALIDCACPKPEAPTCDCGYYQRTGSTHNFNCATLKPTPEAPPREFTLLCENGNGWWKVVEYPNGFHPKGEKFKVIEYGAFEKLQGEFIAESVRLYGAQTALDAKERELAEANESLARTRATLERSTSTLQQITDELTQTRAELAEARS